MGWGTCVNSEGRDCGYMIDAICDFDGCESEIDRGLAYVCGDMHDGGEFGCGRYFCYDHLIQTGIGQFCEECANLIEEEL